MVGDTGDSPLCPVMPTKLKDENLYYYISNENSYLGPAE